MKLERVWTSDGGEPYVCGLMLRVGGFPIKLVWGDAVFPKLSTITPEFYNELEIACKQVLDADS